ncbi:MAG: LysR family transcriptional regulator [Myxococcota bacterium]
MTDELAQFLRVVDTGTFTAAAKAVHLSQPALTASIHRLEQAMGARLLDRGPHGATPTAAGRALIPWARAALSAVERGRRAVREVDGLEAGEVHLGAGATACSVWLPPVLHAFHGAHPGIRLTLREVVADVVAREIDDRRLDLGIVADAGTERWLDDELVLVAAPGADPARLPHLTFPVGANHRTVLDRAFPGVEIAMELSSLAAVRAHVEIGMGQALLSRASVGRALAAGRLVEVRDPRTPIRRTLYLVHPGVDRLSPAARALRAALLAADPAGRPAAG